VGASGFLVLHIFETGIERAMGYRLAMLPTGLGKPETGQRAPTQSVWIQNLLHLVLLISTKQIVALQ
jgi:hypothetical protein